MALEWWQMPGPSKLIEGVVRDLEDGNCAVVSLPKYAPLAFRQALRRHAERPRAPREWNRLTGDFRRGQSLSAWLWEQWHGGTDKPCPPYLTLGQLLDQPFENGGAIWELPPLDEVETVDWLKFLDDYQQALQLIPRLRRNVLIVIVEDTAVLSCLSRRNQPQLLFHSYKLQPSRIDMLLFLSQQLSSTVTPKTTSVERELLIQTAAALYPADPQAALQFAEQNSFDECLITKQIQQEQKQRGWTSITNPTLSDASWVAGLISYVDEQAEHHICAPHEAPLEARIRQALWLAQVRVLLPWMEYQRWRLLHKPELKRYLLRELQEKPYKKTYEGGKDVVISEPERLEPIQILSVLHRKYKYRTTTGLLGSEQLHHQLETLLTCRNDLSHLSPLSAQQITALLDAGW